MSTKGIKDLIQVSYQNPEIAAELDEIVAHINSVAFEHGFDNGLLYEEFTLAFLCEKPDL